MTKRLKGIFKTSQEIDQPEGTYRDARNVDFDESLGAITNEKGTVISANMSAGFIANGHIYLPDERVVIFSYKEDPLTSEITSEIGIFNGTSYSVLLNDTSLPFKLNFHPDHYVQGATFFDERNDRIIYWVDGLNNARFYNLDNPPSTITASTLSMFPSTDKQPKLDLVSVNSRGGTLQAGTYYFAIAYKHRDESITNFYTIEGPVQIVQDRSNRFGSRGGTNTSKSITFKVSNVDQEYESILVAAIPIREGVIDQIELLPELPVTSTEFTYSGGEGSSVGALEELQIDKAFFTSPETVHVYDDQLLLGNVSELETIDYQPYANNIKVDLITSKLFNGANNNGYTIPYHAFKKKSFRRGEVYALYISLLLKEGGESDAFHIPGRLPDAADLEGSTNTFATGSVQVINTKVVSEPMTVTYNGNSVFPFLENDDSPTTVANKIIAAIENNSEIEISAEIGSNAVINFTSKLPGIEGNKTIEFDFAQPDLLSVESVNLSGGENQNTMPFGGQAFHYTSIGGTRNMGYWENASEVYPDTEDWEIKDGAGAVIGTLRPDPITGEPVNVRHHAFPDEEFFNVQEGDNTIVLGFQLSDVNIPNDLQDQVIGYKVYYAEKNISNRRILDQSLLLYAQEESAGILRAVESNGTQVFDDHYYTHPFTMLRNRQSTGNITHFQMLGITDDVDTQSFSETNYESITINHKRSTTYNSRENVPILGSAYIDSENNPATANLTRFGFDKSFNNFSGEGKLVLRTNPYTVTGGTDNYPMVNLRSHRVDLFTPFDRQPLVFTGYTHTNTEDLNSTAIFGGDTYLTPYHYRTNRMADNTGRLTRLHKVIVESYDNINYRYAGSEPWEGYSPLVEDADAHKVDFTDDGQPTNDIGVDTQVWDNFFFYSEDFSRNNNFRFPGINPKFNKQVDKFTTRVIKNTGGASRTFLQNDFADLPTSKGELIKLTTYNNVLIPHMQRAITRTRAREELQVNDVRAFIGSGDIFSVKPEELIYSEDGFAGIQNKRHSIATNYGYFFIDWTAKRIYLLNNDGLNDISEPIRDDIRGLADDTVVLGYDPFRERVLFTFKDNQLTYSYYPKLKAWISKHDYFPDIYFNRQLEFYSIKDNGVHKHHSGDRGSFYGTVNQTLYQFIENNEQIQGKFIMTLVISSDLFDNAGDLDKKKTFNQFQISNSWQDTGLKDIEYFNIESGLNNPYIGNARRTKELWVINNFRDVSNIPGGTPVDKEWVYSKKLEDKWHKVTLIKDNTDNEIIYLYGTFLTHKDSIR